MPLRAPKGFIDETDPKVCQIGHPAPPWLVNYADLMTELVCFFVILYALGAALNKNVQQAKSDVDKMMKEGKLSGETKMDKDGLKISLEEQGSSSFFASASADTTPEIDNQIQKLAPILRKLAQEHDIIVEGHTDNQGIRNEYYDSNWELSTSRATSVARLLIDKYGISPARVGAIGYGEYRPIASNATPDGRAKNRRVVFLIKNGSSEPLAPPVAGGVGGASGAAPAPAGAAPPSQPPSENALPATPGPGVQAQP